MFTNNFKLDGIENILDDIGYLDEMKGAGEDQEHKYTKKSGKKSNDFDGDGTVEDETDEYAGVKDRAIKKASGKCSKCGKEPCECDTKKESVDFSSVLDELTDEDIIFLSDSLIEEVVEEFFYETLEEGFEIEELETLLIEHVDSELAYLEEAKVTVGHDSGSEVSRPSRLAKVKDAVKKVASGAKAVAKKVAHGAGEVAGSAVAGYRKATAAAKDAPSATKSDSNDSKTDSPRTGSGSSGGSSATGTKRPGLLGRIASGLKSGLKKAIHGAGKAAGKVVKTAKAGYDEGRGKTAPSPEAKPAASSAAKPAAPAAKKASAKKKSGGNLDNLLKQIRSEEVELEEGKNKAGKEQGADGKACWKGYKYAGTENGKDKCVPMEEYIDVYTSMIEEGYTIDQVREVLAAYEDGFEVIFEEDGVTINENQEVLDEETEFLADVEMVADWLHAEGVIENEDQFFELMEDLSEEEIRELYDLVLEATAMAKRGYDETKLRKRASGGEAADRATALEKKPTFGDKNKEAQRQKYARAQRGDYRKTASSNPGLHGYAHKSDDPKVKAKQAARGAQRGALTPKEKKELNMGYEMIGNSLEEGGLEVQNIHEISADLGLRASKAADKKRAELARAGDREGAAAKAAQAKRLYGKQAARRLGREEQTEMIGNSLEEGGLEVRNYSWEEVNEAQEARNNPEKYEAGQKKKYAPVRGEKTPMPPRGDKRREDFEKWYAANVR
jgi:hypothetical protein